MEAVEIWNGSRKIFKTSLNSFIYQKKRFKNVRERSYYLSKFQLQQIVRVHIRNMFGVIVIQVYERLSAMFYL